MKRELQSLAGHLNLACKVVRPGRRLLRGCFCLLSLLEKRSHLVESAWLISVIGSGGMSSLDRGYCKDPVMEYL